MRTFSTQKDLKVALQELREKKIGFVPTMGALHTGHSSLLIRAKAECDVVVCSIFVNPTQFNDPKDLEKYPITIDADKQLLESVGCDILYLPSDPADVYLNETDFNVDLGILDQIMEGTNRPGHFDGVMRVVKLLFEIVEPTHAYFGLKDYQQYQIIKTMSEQLKLGVEVIPCKIIREADGLAKSSRNLLLTLPQRQIATTLIKTLSYARLHFDGNNVEELEKTCTAMMAQYGQPEYFIIRRADNLEHIPADYEGEIRCFTVCKIGNVRLLDNLRIR
jgi:pantoate--beta-alanine ligase